MGASTNIISNLSKDKYTIKAQSTQTISFMGANPNYYRVTNGGSTPLYLGVSMMPTEHFCDQKIPPATTKVFVDAYGHEEIYIYNPSITDANIVITSFSADFNPTVLALSDIGQDFSSIEFSGEVDASGDLKTLITNIKNNSANNSTTLDTILSELELIKESVTTLKEIPCTKWYKGTNTDAENKYTMQYIELLSNDSDTDLFVTISSTGNITLKPGEVLNKIKLDAVRTITIPKYATYRLIGG